MNVVARQVMMSRIRSSKPTGGVPPIIANLSDGYARNAPVCSSASPTRGCPTPSSSPGDIHSTWLSELRVDVNRPEHAPLACEMVATSISSDFPIAFDAPLKAVNPTLNPHVRYFDGLTARRPALHSRPEDLAYGRAHRRQHRGARVAVHHRLVRHSGGRPALTPA